MKERGIDLSDGVRDAICSECPKAFYDLYTHSCVCDEPCEEFYETYYKTLDEHLKEGDIVYDEFLKAIIVKENNELMEYRSIIDAVLDTVVRKCRT